MNTALFAAPQFARSPYPPTFKNARVETYRTIGSTELKLWIFGESDPKAKKPAIVFFFGGGWHGGTPAHHIGPHTPPTLILHGKQDTTVPYASVVAFDSVMKKAERPCKLVGTTVRNTASSIVARVTPRHSLTPTVSSSISAGSRSEVPFQKMAT